MPGMTGYDDMTSTGTRLKVGIIDTGFDGWRMSSLQGLLPTPPDLDEDGNARVKTKCYIKTSNGVWKSSDFEGCEAPNHDKASDNTHGTSGAETIYAIAPEVEFYISNAPSGSEQRKAIEWMESEGVVVMNRSFHGNFQAPGDGNPYSENDVDSSSGVKVTVGSNLSLNGNCTSGRLTQDTVDYGDEIDIKGCSAGDSTVQLNHATDNAVSYKSYTMTINQNTAFRCDRGRGVVANSSSFTWTNTWYSYCNAVGPGSSGISRYNSFSAPGSDYIWIPAFAGMTVSTDNRKALSVSFASLAALRC